MSLDDLPEEILVNVVQRLPIKTIGQCMCVKKQWRSFIKTPSFVYLNTTFSNRNQYSLFWSIFWNNFCRGDNRIVARMFIDSDDTFEFSNILTFPRDACSDISPIYPIYPISHCNGVICFAKENGKTIILWNPTIRKMVTLTLPDPNFPTYNPESDDYNLGFGFDSLTNDYKLVRIFYFGLEVRHSQIEIFSLNTNSWKLVSMVPPNYAVMERSRRILSGSMHWLCYMDDDGTDIVIAAFDVNAETFREISLPNNLRERRGLSLGLSLDVYKQTFIAVCCCDMLDTNGLGVWVMKEYGNVDSWTKIWEFRGPIMNPYSAASIVGLRFKGEVLWNVISSDIENYEDEYDDKAMAFSSDPETGEFKQILTDEIQYLRIFNIESINFEESLVLLDNVNATSCTN